MTARDVYVFPAHAGMDRECLAQDLHLGTCSPHTRGWTGACESLAETHLCVPRTRGDGPRE